jgi:hypothetical protein
MTRRPSPRCRGDNGTAIVEFALVAPVLFVLVAGIFEFGFAWHSANLVERSVQNGGRAASNAGDSRLADYDALRALDATLAGSNAMTIKRVIIYKSDATGTLPASCDDPFQNPVGTGIKGVSGVCNVYSPEQVAQTNPLAGFPPGTGILCPGDWDTNWCPLGRDNSRPISDYIGVYVEANYRPVTQLLPTTFTIERKAVFLLEPPSIGS